jgi:hypothetical protein
MDGPDGETFRAMDDQIIGDVPPDALVFHVNCESAGQHVDLAWRLRGQDEPW